MELIPNIVGYHANYDDKIESFVNDRILQISKDTHYMGKGMYFWDNQANAKFWAEKKIKDSILSHCWIAKASILLDSDILDLTDKDKITEIQILWRAFCNKLGCDMIQPLGTILNTLFEYFSSTLGKIKVVKCVGNYSSIKQHLFLNELGKNSWIDDRPKTIYSVKCNTKIANQSKFLKISSNI
ncbi:MAG: hypothetical protein A3D31_14355 [Candidatus Fluviicola riflensis]|nr:MAG: hypothetical protein CHH17_18790 [Candidatus Fluviicola riflensis]OGS78153.1 MAG: hypothetical protein A3D31_14355 [Candidatus Fluviicola riflensis]OGS85219.1 MAG: hypothetical protein A2724_11290 [Fluviicola sp. RIFCSPHIGHO2_01_FULL_43_53]OGS89490.1 MAG: hypothetical protein A3E30_05595 [Fluviicola sp. RIFCSPHIGHO2_12_FULL_43_24]